MSYEDWKPLYRKLTRTYGKKDDGEQCAAYFEALGEFSADRMREAVTRTVAEVKFFPKAAELRERAQAAVRSAPMAPQECYRCGGSTWVPGPPRHMNGLVYETVERCGDCWPFPVTRTREEVGHAR